MSTGADPLSNLSEEALKALIPAHAQVHVIDDDEAVRDSLRWLLEGNGFQASAHPDAESFLAIAESLRDKVVCLVIDVRMPGMSGLALQEEMLRRELDLPLVFITGHGDVPMAVASMKRGAIDFLEKPFSDAHLCLVVRQALARAAIGLRDARQRQRQHHEDRDAAQRMDRLTQRERQVLALVVAGRLNKQIADDLGISIKTVEAHRANLMDKLAARTMADLMKIALRSEGGR